MLNTTSVCRCILLSILLIVFKLGHAQIYYDQGRQISGSDSIAYIGSTGQSINPSYPAISGRSFNFGFLQGGISTHSEVLDNLYLQQFTLSNDSITQNDRDAIRELVPESLDFQARLDVKWLNMSFNLPKLMAFSAELSESVQSDLFLDEQMTNLFLDGLNASWLPKNASSADLSGTQGSRIYYNHTRTLKLGLSRRIVDQDSLKIFAGANISRVWGLGHLDMIIDQNRIKGQSSFSEFYDINYGSLDAFRDNLSKKLLSSSGTGWIYDIGVSLQLHQRFDFGVAVLDMGFLEWDDQTSASDTDAIALNESIENGVSSFAFQDESNYLYDALGFEVGPSFRTEANTRLRLNTLYRIDEKFSTSIDWLIPLREIEGLSYHSFILGMRYRPGLIPVNFSSGVFYHSDFGLRVPFGLGIDVLGTGIVSISTNDIISLVSGNTNPVSSLSVVIAGVRF